jgi:hypothetical protein
VQVGFGYALRNRVEERSFRSRAWDPGNGSKETTLEHNLIVTPPFENSKLRKLIEDKRSKLCSVSQALK